MFVLVCAIYTVTGYAVKTKFSSSRKKTYGIDPKIFGLVNDYGCFTLKYE